MKHAVDPDSDAEGASKKRPTVPVFRKVLVSHSPAWQTPEVSGIARLATARLTGFS